jgi:hypothetical protein
MSEKPSAAWYLAPIFLGIIGSAIMWYVLKDEIHPDSPKMIKKGWVIGIVLTLLPLLMMIPMLLLLPMAALNDFDEMKDHMEAIPDPTVQMVPDITERMVPAPTAEERDEVIWQTLQKTYLMQECREKFMGQADEMEECFKQIDEEQRLNPPIKPSESECSIQCLVYDPVCGEDKITYACGLEDAACHGVEVEYEGECIDLTSSYMEKITPTLDDFRITLSESVDIDTIFSKFGDPHDDIGSGIHIYVYELNDFSEIWIGYVEDILYVKHVDADGNKLEELFVKTTEPLD